MMDYRPEFFFVLVCLLTLIKKGGNTIDASISKQEESSVSVKENRKRFVSEKPEKCTNHGNGCRSKTNGVVPEFKQNKNGSWKVACLACLAYYREIDKKRKAKNRALIEADTEESSIDLDGPPSHCSNEIHRVCFSKRQGLVPEFQRMRNGRWYKICKRCRIESYERRKKWMKRHSEEAEHQGKKFCERCFRYLDDCAFAKNEVGENKSTCIECCEMRTRYYKLSTNCKIQSICDRAKHRKCTVSMTHEEMGRIIRMLCIYCGINNENGMNGLDRIDSSIRVYEKDNVVPCCGRCNVTKGVLSVDVFIKRMYHYAFQHCDSNTVPGKEFREAFENPNVKRRSYSAITGEAKRDGFECHFTREQYEKALDDRLCDICKINPSTSIIRYRRDRDLSLDNFSRVCKCCSSMLPSVAPSELPALAKTIVLHSEKTGLLNKIESGQPIFVFEEDAKCSNEE